MKTAMTYLLQILLIYFLKLQQHNPLISTWEKQDVLTTFTTFCQWLTVKHQDIIQASVLTEMDRPGILLLEKLGCYNGNHNEPEQLHKTSALITTDNTNFIRD